MSSKYCSKIGWFKGVTQIAVSLTAVVSTSTAAQALNFNFSYAPGTSLEQMLAFEMAGNIWSSYMNDDATINIHIEMTDLLPNNVIGGSLPGVKAQHNLSDFQDSLAGDGTSLDDLVASNHFNNNLLGLTVKLNNNGTNNQVQNINTINMTRANAKALGIIDGNDTALDGFILMNDLSNKPNGWSYDFLSSIAPNNSLDFLSVAIHELGHNLGFVSGVDDADLLEAVHNNSNQQVTGESFEYLNPLDLFRYSTDSAAEGMQDLSIGGDPYFSLDGGQTNLGNFAKGEDISLGGDGNQASHWQQQSDPLGIFDPVLKKGQKRNIEALDLRAMDAIGWDLSNNLRDGIEANELGLDLTALKALSEQGLADRLGVSVADLYANATTSAQALTQDRSVDLEAMIQNSQIYEWGTPPVCTPVNGVCTTCTDRNRNGICDSQESPWQKVDWELGAENMKTEQIPEPRSILALIGIGLLGLCCSVKLS
jgi:hypothetical protein